MQRLSPKSTVNRGLLQGGEGVLLARRMRMLCWWSKRLRCFDMVKDAFHPIVTSSFFFAGHPHPSRSAPPSPPWGRPPMTSPLGNRRYIFVTVTAAGASPRPTVGWDKRNRRCIFVCVTAAGGALSFARTTQLTKNLPYRSILGVSYGPLPYTALDGIKSITDIAKSTPRGAFCCFIRRNGNQSKV